MRVNTIVIDYTKCAVYPLLTVIKTNTGKFSFEKKNGTGKYYYIATDGLGSINMIVNANDGTIASDMSYDAWGRRRNPWDWTYTNITTSNITDRGFTMHEMLDNFDLINMNGRAYDPLLGQFLSPDPFVSNPENPQGYNRYAYCLNNPLKYTDPSGYCDWQWFITQNISSAALDYRSYMFHDRYNNTFSRQMQQSLNKIVAYRNWDEKYNMFKKNYDRQSFIQRTQKTIWSAQELTGKKVVSGIATLTKEDKPDVLILKYNDGSEGNWTNGVEEVATQFEFKELESGFMDVYFTAKPSGAYGPPTGKGLIPDIKISFNHGIPQIETSLLNTLLGEDAVPAALGLVIIYPKNGTKRSMWTKHEPGHVMQYLILGPAYWTVIAGPSLISSQFFQNKHGNMPWEKSANQLWYMISGEKDEDLEYK